MIVSLDRARRTSRWRSIECRDGGRTRKEAILKLAELMRSKDVPPRTVLAAITELLDRGIGKPVQLTAMPMLEAPRTGDEAKDVTPGRPVIIEQDPLYHSYLAWNKALKQ